MDLHTFKTSILPNKNKLYRVALRITGNPAEAEDVVQETLIKVWEKRNDWSRIDNLQAWCMQMVKNRAIDKVRLKANQTENIDTLYSMSSREILPDRKAELSDTVGKVKQLMQQLPDQQRLAMHLRDIEGMSYQEISQVMEISLSQVKTNIFRARKGIKSKLLQLWTTS
ncbi:MAG: sigma-70 family RNA polymerase sigma factor [Chitinophagales bacterium]|nr:sigma-70 family RNA polymerase sigma factor [Chitinophagales bacterium]